MAYAVPHNYTRPTGYFPAGRGPARHQPTRNNPARPIGDIFVSTSNIGGWVRGKEREGRGERPQGPAGGWYKNTIGRTVRGCLGKAARRGRYGAADNREGGDNGREGAWTTGPL